MENEDGQFYNDWLGVLKVTLQLTLFKGSRYCEFQSQGRLI